MIREKTVLAARGKWSEILQALGVPKEALRNRHGPCPIPGCGGKDRFRWDNKDSHGTWICTQCGAGFGIDLAIKYTGRPFRILAPEIDRIIDNVKFATDMPKQEQSEASRRAMLRDIWAATAPIEVGDLAHKYFESRNIDELTYPKALRFARALRDGEGGIRPCMVAMVGVYGESKYCGVQRTFLRPDGLAKAEMQAPKKTAGKLLPGSCVALSEYAGGPLGIAEGIETAMSASNLFEMPVWASLNAQMMVKWRPPEGCTEVVIYGDNDASFTGHKAAYMLAWSLRKDGIDVQVKIPDAVGDDWADVYMRG